MWLRGCQTSPRRLRGREGQELRGGGVRVRNSGSSGLWLEFENNTQCRGSLGGSYTPRRARDGLQGQPALTTRLGAGPCCLCPGPAATSSSGCSTLQPEESLGNLGPVSTAGSLQWLHLPPKKSLRRSVPGSHLRARCLRPRPALPQTPSPVLPPHLPGPLSSHLPSPGGGTAHTSQAAPASP